jgi:hypothetical protein
MHILGHFPSSISLKKKVQNLDLLQLSGEDTQPNKLGPLDKANLNPNLGLALSIGAISQTNDC